MARIGAEVPDFEVKAYHEGEEKNIKLSDYRGKWLCLIFYPADFTFVCPTELEDAANLYPEFQKANAEILSISTDTVFVHKAWHDASEAIGKVNYPMVADPTGKLFDEIPRSYDITPITATYSKCIANKTPFLISGSFLTFRQFGYGERLVVPLSNDGFKVDKLVTCLDRLKEEDIPKLALK